MIVVATTALVLAGCTADPEPEPDTAISDPTTPVAPEAAAVLVPEGDAEANLPYFTSIVQNVAAGGESALGRAYVDALVSGGFDKGAMQVTEDESTVGNPAESIQVSVRWGEECLMGQVGPATGAPVTTVMSGLATGGCLVGATRPIDW